MQLQAGGALLALLLATGGNFAECPDALRLMRKGAWIFADDTCQLAWEQDGDHWIRTDRIELGKVRHLIEHQQASLALPDGPVIALRWQARTGGTFGPLSSAEANRRPRGRRPGASPSPPSDRGTAVAWHVSFACPKCDRSCRVLWNPLWSWRHHGVGQTAWQCQSCEASPCRYKWPSQRWTGTSADGTRPASYRYQQHHHAVQRCQALLEQPRWLTTDRFMALWRLKRAHGVLAAAACCSPLFSPSSIITADEINAAQATIEADRWAMRQRTWHRKGKPRPGPAGREQQAAPLMQEEAPIPSS